MGDETLIEDVAAAEAVVADVAPVLEEAVVDAPAPVEAPEPGDAEAAFEDLGEPRASSAALQASLAPVLDVNVDLVVEIGRTRMTIRETLAIGRGSLVTLDKLAGEPADLLVNGRLIARGEVVAIDEEFGLRVTEVVSPERRLEAGRG